MNSWGAKLFRSEYNSNQAKLTNLIDRRHYPSMSFTVKIPHPSPYQGRRRVKKLAMMPFLLSTPFFFINLYLNIDANMKKYIPPLPRPGKGSKIRNEALLTANNFVYTKNS